MRCLSEMRGGRKRGVQRRLAQTIGATTGTTPRQQYKKTGRIFSESANFVAGAGYFRQLQPLKNRLNSHCGWRLEPSEHKSPNGINPENHCAALCKPSSNRTTRSATGISIGAHALASGVKQYKEDPLCLGNCLCTLLEILPKSYVTTLFPSPPALPRRTGVNTSSASLLGKTIALCPTKILRRLS